MKRLWPKSNTTKITDQCFDYTISDELIDDEMRAAANQGIHKSIDYKFREDELIVEFKAYIDATYQGHYAQNKLQSAEVIIDRGHGLGFFLGNCDKYLARYGMKGTTDDYRKDMMKVLHYALLTLFEHDRIHNPEK